jgi:microsomal dipeptidase-like Zn-dependent dipeptidase
MFSLKLIPTLLLASVAFSQPFDFENGTSGWRAEGDAFTTPCNEFSSTQFADPTLGGNYWKDLRYPIGQHGNCLLTSALKSSHSPASLTSPDFLLRPYLSFRIGGTKDLANERLELLVQVPRAQQDAVAGQIESWHKDRKEKPEVTRDGEYLIAYSATGSGANLLRQEVVAIPAFLQNLTARVRAVDRSATGHLNLDYIQTLDSEPPPLHTPVFGFADYHTHPMSHFAFGGHDQDFPLFGDPGNIAGDYENGAVDIATDIPHCVHGHGGGYFAEAFINTSQLMNYGALSIIESIILPHKRSGGPEFRHFPDHLMGAHQQDHITMIKRSYDGGLRLVVALATDNAAAQFLTGVVRDKVMPIVREKDSIQTQLQRVKDRAAANSDWMEIAYSAADARRIIQNNKLAVVLGVEIDQLGQFNCPIEQVHCTPSPDEIKTEADLLWSEGVRAVTPIHAADNLLGGPSVFIEPYNWLNDLLHRDNINSTSWQVRKTQPAYFDIRQDDAGCSPNPAVHRGECVLRELSADLELRVALGYPLFNWFRKSPVIMIQPKTYQFDTLYGHKNQKGLLPFGKQYIKELMDRGIIVDTAHMSDLSVQDTYDLATRRLSPACKDKFFSGADPGDCGADAYPAIISHAHMRAQALYGQTDVVDYKPSEYDISDWNLKVVQRSGAVIGPFVAEARIDETGPQLDLPFPANCGNSSVDFGYSLHYAISAVNTPADSGAWASRVGFATDMTFIPMVSPRFGSAACDGYTALKHGKAEKAKHPDRYVHGDDARNQRLQAARRSRPDLRIEQVADMTCRVSYQPGVGCNPNDPLKQNSLDQRHYDFNVDGLAHYGLLPDMLQDLKNLKDPDLKALFQSAEGYLQMWEKVERLRTTHK